MPRPMNLCTNLLSALRSPRLRCCVRLGVLFLLLCPAWLVGQSSDTSRFTDVGNIRLMISNFGTIGSGWAGWPAVPSCEYPRGSKVEHLFIGGIWLGGIREVNGNRMPLVSTGAVDVSAVREGLAGFELTTELRDRMIERSSNIESPFYTPAAVSEQDFVAKFVDTNRYIPDAARPREILEHLHPLGLSVQMESYAWSYPFADNFVVLRYRIRNVSSAVIDSFHVGLWSDLVVRNTQFAAPGGSAFYSSGGNGFVDSLRMVYEYDASNGQESVNGYAALKLLGTMPPTDSAYFNFWQFRNATGAPWTTSPADDEAKFRRLSSSFLGGDKTVIAGQLKSPSNRSAMISAGPFPPLNPGDSIEAVFAVIAAKKSGPSRGDEEQQRRALQIAASWAQRAYDGSDQNGNGTLDPGEPDVNGNGEIARYLLPAPPRSPRVRVVPSDRRITLYWNNAPESATDILTNRKTFEGYRVYRSNPGDDLDATIDSLVLVAQFDLRNRVGLNTGLNGAKILDENGQPAPIRLPDDTAEYHYRLTFDSVLNGWQYGVAVTAFSAAEEAAGIPAFESSPLTSLKRAIPGTTASGGGDSVHNIGVYPNPYYVNAVWDGAGERQRKIWFYNLPARSRVTIYSPAGDVVATLDHDAATYNGSDLGWFNSFADGTQLLAGGEHAWDLITSGDQALATGIYLFAVEDLVAGGVKMGRFVVMK